MHGHCTMSYKLKKVNVFPLIYCFEGIKQATGKTVQVEMIDMLRELDLISPERSILVDGSVSFFNGGDDASLASLDWGACEVHSVQSFCSSTPPPEKMHGYSDLLALCATASNRNKRGLVERIETERRKKIAADEAGPGAAPEPAMALIPTASSWSGVYHHKHSTSSCVQRTGQVAWNGIE